MCENQVHVCWKRATACLGRSYPRGPGAPCNTDEDLLLWTQQAWGRGVPLRQVRQVVDSKVQGPKVQEGKDPAPLSSSSVTSCLLMGGGVKKQWWMDQDLKKRKEKGFLSLIKSIQMQMSLKRKGLRCSQGMMSKVPPAMVGGCNL